MHAAIMGDEYRHRRAVEEELFVQAARFGHWFNPSSSARVYEALQAAARNGHAPVVKDLLLRMRCSFNGFGPKTLREAEVNLLFSDHKRVSPTRTWYFYGDKMLLSPLHLAVKEGHAEVVHELLAFLKRVSALLCNARQNAWRRKEKETTAQEWFQGLVEWAVRWGHASIVKMLLPTMPHKALLPIKDVFLPLHLAAHLGHMDVLEVLLQLLPHTKLSNEVIEPSSTVSRAGSQERNLFKEQQCLASQFKRYLSCFSKDGLTALHVAAQCGCLAAVELLVTTSKMDVKLPSNPESITSCLPLANLDVDSRSSPELFTPLHMAASAGHVDVVRFLLDEGGNPSARDCMGRTALHYAAREGHEDVAEELLSCKLGAESQIASISDNDGLLPLHMAAKGGHVEVIRTLRRFVCGNSSTSTRVKNSIEMRRWVEHVYMNGRIISSYHCYFSKKWRFPRPMLIDSFFWRTEGFTPLHFAARYGHEAAVRELLQQDMETGEIDVGERVRLLSLKDSGGFLVYDWMQVQKQGDALIRHATDGVQSAQDRLIVEESLKKGSYVAMSNIRRNKRILELASEVEKEKQALEELHHAWASRNPGIHHAEWESGKYRDCAKHNYSMSMRACILQWLIQSEDYSECSMWHSADAFSALLKSLKQGRFAVAKEILLLQPEIGHDARVMCREVKDILMSLSLDYLSEELKSLLETFLIVLVTRDNLIGASNLLRWLLPWATERHLTGLVDVILDRPELKRGLYEDRQVYLDCANAILVGAALIAGVAFFGWLQPPMGYVLRYEGEDYADIQHRAVREFWWFNCGAFFFAVGSLIAGAKGAVPVAKETGIVSTLAKIRRAVAVASVLLGAALVCVVGAFAAAGIAVLPPIAKDLHIMHTCVSWGATICGLCLLWFSASVWPLIVETIVYWSELLHKIYLDRAYECYSEL